MESDDYKVLIHSHQASTLKEVLKDALKYHFENFSRLEELGDPAILTSGDQPIEEVTARMRANTHIKFEVMAYINQLRRLKHFINYLKKNGEFSPPDNSDLLQVWKDIMDEDGVINILANKWTAHRSVDDPRNESDSFHLAVLLNLESTITMWGNGHMYLSFDRYEFYLHHHHPSILEFVNWVFNTLEKLDPSSVPQKNILQDAAGIDLTGKKTNSSVVLVDN